MATVILMPWPEMNKAQYEQARRDVNFEGEVPQRRKFHVAWFGACLVTETRD